MTGSCCSSGARNLPLSKTADIIFGSAQAGKSWHSERLRDFSLSALHCTDWWYSHVAVVLWCKHYSLVTADSVLNLFVWAGAQMSKKSTRKSAVCRCFFSNFCKVVVVFLNFISRKGLNRIILHNINNNSGYLSRSPHMQMINRQVLK